MSLFWFWEMLATRINSFRRAEGQHNAPLLSVSLHQLAQPVKVVVVAENVLYSGKTVNY